MTNELVLSLQMGALRLRSQWPGHFASSGRVRMRVTGQTLRGQTGDASSWSRRSVAHTGRDPQCGVGWVAPGPKRISFLVPWDNMQSPPLFFRIKNSEFCALGWTYKIAMLDYFYLHKLKFYRIQFKISQFLKQCAAQMRLVSGSIPGHRLPIHDPSGKSPWEFLLSLIGRKLVVLKARHIKPQVL